MSQVQTAGISSILMQMLRYFTDTQTGIQTATTDIFRQINPIFLFFKRVQSWSHVSFWDQRKFGWNHCYMSQVQTAGISSILIQMLRYFTDTQTAIQTATTSIFRQINAIFPFFKTSQSCPHVVFWRHLTDVITVAVRTQMRFHATMTKLVLLYLLGQL